MFIKSLSIIIALFCTAAQAALKWDYTDYATKSVPGQKSVTIVFPFKNIGDYPVRIKKIRSACSCTTAKLEKETYSPGESGEISITFNFGNRIGKHTKSVMVEMDDMAFPVVALNIRALIKSYYTPCPQELQWNISEEATTKEALLHFIDGIQISMKDPVWDSDKISSVRLEKTEKPNIYRITVTPKTTDFRFDSEIFLTAEDKSGKPLDLNPVIVKINNGN